MQTSTSTAVSSSEITISSMPAAAEIARRLTHRQREDRKPATADPPKSKFYESEDEYFHPHVAVRVSQNHVPADRRRDERSLLQCNHFRNAIAIDVADARRPASVVQ